MQPLTSIIATSGDVQAAVRRGHGRRLGLLACLPAGLDVRALRAHIQAWVLFIVLAISWCASQAHAATPPNTPIANTANLSYDISGITLTSSSVATVTTAGITPATIQFLSYTPGVNAGVGGTTTYNTPPTACQLAGSSGFTTTPNPVVAGAGTLATPGNYPLAPAGAYNAGSTAFILVTDYSANQDPNVAEPLDITVTTPSGDSERLRLTETGTSTGLFLGFIRLRSGAIVPGDCVLEAKSDEKLTATYVQSGSSAVSTSTALVDPLGLVFDSATGQPVDGVRVTLIDVNTNAPAAVFGDDGVSTYPSSILTGSSVTDSGGTVYSLGSGRFQFPRVNAPGTYRLQIETPLGYSFPSKVSDATLQALPGGPFAISTISRGGQFVVLPGPPVRADVPLDPGPLGSVNITKTAAKPTAAPGDFVPYTVTITANGTQALPGVQIMDRMPPGFRYLRGSLRRNGAATADPQVSADGRSVVFDAGTVAPQTVVTLTYLTVVGPTVAQGPSQNTAQAIGRIASNVASAFVTIRDDLNRSRAILAGQVTVASSCEADTSDRASRVPLAGVRVLLEDGTYVLTDKDGNWHVDNVLPGTHVVQVDTVTLPQGMVLQSCEKASRYGGRGYSQAVNVRAGTLWRADFRFAPAPACLQQSLERSANTVRLGLDLPLAHAGTSATLLLPDGVTIDPASVKQSGSAVADVQSSPGFVVLRTPASSNASQLAVEFQLSQPTAELRLAVRTARPGAEDLSLPVLNLPAGAADAQACAPLPAPDVSRLRPAAGVTGGSAPGAGQAAADTSAAPQRLVEVLPYDDKWLAAAEPGYEWLHPKSDFQPALPVVRIAVKHDAAQQLELRVNGKAVDVLRFEGTQLNPTGKIGLSEWKAVELREGENALEMIVKDANGLEILREQRKLHYGVTPAKAVLVLGKSTLLADGRTVPVIAVRFSDADGKPVRRGTVGDFSVEAPYLPRQVQQAIQRDPLTANIGNRPKFEIGEDGVALIPLQPTGQSGEAVLRFDFGGSRQAQVRAWLQPGQREWVLVGFAEGTAGHKVLSGNMQALQDDGADDKLFDNNRLAFYAKGTIKGEYLLTAAYDTARSRGTTQPVLGQVIDPNAFYTLYGDATRQAYDAASIRNLYLKIEKQQFYLLFGDYSTGLTVSELGRYSRIVNGLKSEYKGETLSYTAFATRTSQAFWKDEIQGDGTSGLFRLRGRNIKLNTDKVRIEVRDRFQSDRVLKTQALTPWLDYQLDYALGTILLRNPLAARDDEFNPQLLVVEYETDNGGAQALTYGGRAAVQVGQANVGLTRIREGDAGRDGALTAADAQIRIDDSTRARVEVASSHRNADTGALSGGAYVAEVIRDDGKNQVRAYARQQEAGFGLGQQTALATGQRRIGVEGRSKLNDTVQAVGEVSRAESIVSGASRDVVAGMMQWQAQDNLRLQAGARAIQESDGQGGETSTRQLTGGMAYELMDKRLLLRASTDLALSSTSTMAATAFPNRLVLGADYKLTPTTTLTAQQELARGQGVHASITSVGLRTEVWKGGELRSSVGTQETLDSDRLYASMGLVQRWQIDERWSASAGVEQSHTISGTPGTATVGSNQIPASGVVASNSQFAALPNGVTPSSGVALVAADYSAVTLGAAYKDTDWSGNGRIEWRGSAVDRRLNVLLGVQRRLEQGQAVGVSLQALSTASADQSNERINLRTSYVWRPSESDWMVVQRLDYVQESSPNLTTALFTRKLINNVNANYKPDARTQVALQYGIKAVRETLQDVTASGVTDLFGIEARYDLTDRVDVGVHAGGLRTWATGQRSGQLGLSVGLMVVTNTWVSVGYNLRGFWDADFAGAQYRAKGLYINLRTKFDQDTLGLNERKSNVISLQP